MLGCRRYPRVRRTRGRASRSAASAPRQRVRRRCRARCVLQPPAPASGGRRWLAPIPAAALSFGIMLGLGTPLLLQLTQGERNETQLPESYGRRARDRGWQAGADRLQPAPRPHRRPQSCCSRWQWPRRQHAVPVDSGRRRRAAGGGCSATPPRQARRRGQLALPRPSEDLFFRAVELVVSIEAGRCQPEHPHQ